MFFHMSIPSFCVAAYALLAGCCYGQQPAPTLGPSPVLLKNSDDKVTEEAKKVVEQLKAPEPRFKLYGWIEAGLTGNPDAPVDNHNFGQLSTDRANEPILNQISIIGERALDPNATGFDWGFKSWFMYGSDSRYTKSLGLLDDSNDYVTQPDFPELYASVHIPVPGTNGLDLKAGKYQDPMSADATDPRSNVFYTYSYIFDFGVPGNETGGLATLHVNQYLDLYAGINRGVNVSLADNNASIAFEGGFGLNLLGGDITTLALTEIGPEDPGDNHDNRYLNDITTTWKVTKNLTSITDFNLIVDSIDGGKWGGGVSQYLTYSLNDWLQVAFRSEFFRDSGGFYVTQFRDNNDFLHLGLQGRAVPFDPSNLGGGDTTYFEVTAGVNFKAPVSKPLAGLLIRPEVRFDQALTSQFKPFDGNTKRNQWTIGLDAILEF
jgi:Putative beta-barrel porin-2, OmpL-like. bbp2